LYVSVCREYAASADSCLPYRLARATLEARSDPNVFPLFSRCHTFEHKQSVSDWARPLSWRRDDRIVVLVLESSKDGRSIFRDDGQQFPLQ